MKDMADRINDHYERHAREWDADRNLHVSPWNDKPWHDRFVAALPRAANVLDLGCGSGAPVAKYMAECGLHVTGVDSSPTLISLCRQRLPDHEWLVDDMRSLRLSRRFDGVLAWDSLFHLTPDERPLSRSIAPKPPFRTSPEADNADFCKHAEKHRTGGRNFGYSPDSIARSSRNRISPSLPASEITKRTFPWLEVSA